MNNKIINYIKKKPKAYEPSSSAFWDDENISKYMLEAHLDKDFEGASRNHKFIEKSVEWISGYCDAKEGKKLLDLGCGPGIYAELFAKQGFSVTGIDFSKRSIEYAKAQTSESHGNIQYHYQNYLDIDFKNQFDIITLIYCDFGVLSSTDRAILLKKIWRALKEDGILILDGFSTKFGNDFEEKELIQYEESGFWSAQPYACIQRNYFYEDTANTLEQYIIITENDCECYNLWNQMYSKEKLVSEINEAGFKKTQLFDDVAGGKFTGQSETICAVAYKSDKVTKINEINNADLLLNLDKLHTTDLGVVRIKRNLCLDVDDVVSWCKERISSQKSSINRKGKNWYIHAGDCEITVNAYSYTIITAHKVS